METFRLAASAPMPGTRSCTQSAHAEDHTGRGESSISAGMDVLKLLDALENVCVFYTVMIWLMRYAEEMGGKISNSEHYSVTV